MGVVLALIAGVWGLTRQRQPPPEPVTHSPARGLASGVGYLLRHQSPDGAWRSDTYGTFKDGTALTPLAVVALIEAGGTVETASSRRAGSEFLAQMVKQDGTIDEGPFGLDYPVYTAALSVIALSHSENADLKSARDAWLKYLLARQLIEPLGWSPVDKEYGGWGYCRTIPRKPEPGKLVAPLIESNLSATVFALDAIAAADHSNPERVECGLLFVGRCRNPDGGFHFIYDDPVRNKAGGGPNGFLSYGSATADGYRAFTRNIPNGPVDHTSLDWLKSRFDPAHHPGDYLPAHERNRDAVYFYYAAGIARVARMTGNRDWAIRLAEAIRERQQPDGSWMNPVDLVREDDPIVATCWAIIALAHCKAVSIPDHNQP